MWLLLIGVTLHLGRGAGLESEKEKHDEKKIQTSPFRKQARN